MQQNNSFGHDGENGNDTGDRLTATGYEWRIVSENVAGGYPDLQAVMADWLASPSHCLTLMNGSAIHMAVRVVDGTSANEYSNYWTLVVAARVRARQPQKSSLAPSSTSSAARISARAFDSVSCHSLIGTES